MAYRIMRNRKNIDFVLHFTANDSVVVTGNTTTGNVALDGEDIVGASIKSIICGSSSGNGSYWTIARNANVVAVVDSTNNLDLAGAGLAITLDSEESDLTCLLHNAADNEGFLIVEMQKLGPQGVSPLPGSDYFVSSNT